MSRRNKKTPKRSTASNNKNKQIDFGEELSNPTPSLDNDNPSYEKDQGKNNVLNYHYSIFIYIKIWYWFNHNLI